MTETETESPTTWKDDPTDLSAISMEMEFPIEWRRLTDWEISMATESPTL
jgi:hypothetical protein